MIFLKRESLCSYSEEAYRYAKLFKFAWVPAFGEFGWVEVVGLFTKGPDVAFGVEEFGATVAPEGVEGFGYGFTAGVYGFFVGTVYVIVVEVEGDTSPWDFMDRRVIFGLFREGGFFGSHHECGVFFG